MQSKRGADKTAIIYRRDKQRERETERGRAMRNETEDKRHETRDEVCGVWHVVWGTRKKRQASHAAS